MKKVNILQITLTYNGNVLFDTEDIELIKEISIGRSSKCTWVIPADDHLVSGVHAILNYSNGKVIIRDNNSKNGTFYQSKKIVEKVVSPGDEYLIGNCVLKINIQDTPKSSKPSSLVFVNSPQKGKRFFLEKNNTTLGSDKECSIIISDPLISSHHATISCNGAEYWIWDNNSSNGTSVNNVPLKGKNKRLLQDGDIVSLSYIDLKFFDGAVEHSPVKIIKTSAVIILTILITLSCYWLYRNFSTQSDEYLDLARAAAEREQFELAFNNLNKAKTCSNAKLYKTQIENISHSLELWKSTMEQWIKAKQLLSQGQWVEASHILGRLESGGADFWGWNATTAIEAKQQMSIAKNLLDYYFSGLNAINSTSNSYQEFSVSEKMTDNHLQRYAKNAPQYLERLLKEVHSVMRQKNKNDLLVSEMQNTLKMLDIESDNYSIIISKLEQLKGNADGYMKLRIQKCLIPLIALQKSNKQLRLQIMYVCNMKFNEALRISLDLPSIEQCSADPHLSSFRKQLEKQHTAVKTAALQLKMLTTDLIKNNFTPTITENVFWGDLYNPEVMRKVFLCDTLQQALPTRGRNIPVGEYDRILGIELFYDFLTALPEPYRPDDGENFSFVPEIMRIKKQLNDLDSFCSYMKIKHNAWLHRGRLLQFFRRGVFILEQRERMVAQLLNNSGELRAEIISMGMGLFLSSSSNYPSEIVEAISSKMRVLRNDLIPINREYNDATAERQIVIRNTILSKGLPGDPLVRRMWGFRYR